MIKAIDNIKIEVFNSVREFTTAIDKRPCNKAFEGARCSSMTEGGNDWYGTETMEQANTIMKTGYKEGCKDLLQCKDGVKVMNDVYHKKTTRSYAGFAPCVPAVIMGLPKTMYRTTRHKAAKPVISLYYDIGVHGGVSKNTMVLGGKNLYSLVKYLESHGVMVNLYCVDGTYISSAHKHAILCIKVKDSAMPINPQLISYPCIHPSFMRRHSFRWTETSEITNYKSLVGSYGACSRSYISLLNALIGAKVTNNDSYYIDVENSARAMDLDSLMQRIGLKL